MTRDLSRSRAILIGNAAFVDPGIPDLPAAAGCVAAMAELLSDELCGWPAERVTRLVDVAAPSELARRLVPAIQDAEDVLLVYYVGHGMRTSEGQLALVLRETDRHPEILPYTGMLYADLARIMRGSRAATKLVILDCCHAELGGRANYIFQSADEFDAHPVDGLYFIGASAKDKAAKAPLDGGLTYFTEAFLRVVRGGLPSMPPTLRLDQIFLALRDTLVRAGQPEPVQSSIRDAQRFAFARNAAAGRADASGLPASMMLALESPSPNVRRAAVEDLGALLEAVEPELVVAARTRLTAIAETDVPTVADVARRVLAEQKEIRTIGTVNGTRFAAAVDAVAVALGNDENVPVLTSILVEFTARRMTIVATDRYRLAVREVPWRAIGTDQPDPIVVSGAELRRVAAEFGGPGGIAVRMGDGVFGLSHGGVSRLTDLRPVEFVKFRTLIPTAFATKADVETGAVRQVVRSVARGSGPKALLALDVGDGQIVVSGWSDERPLTAERVLATVHGPSVRVVLNPRFLIEALESCPDQFVSFSFTDPLKPMAITPVEDASYGGGTAFTHIIMPIRQAGEAGS